MFQLRTVPGPEKRSGPSVVCCIVTRSGRENYLRRTLKGLRRENVQTMLWANGPVAQDVKQGHVYVHEHPYNAGQHVGHNAMLEECTRLNPDWHIRVDDDCWLSTRTWLKRLLTVQEGFKAMRKQYFVAGVDVRGLKEPPAAVAAHEIGRERLEIVNALGGIFRMAPMGIMRYWRFDERLPMGLGDASTFSRYCQNINVDMIRVATIHCSHGDSTVEQEHRNTGWAHEHDMLQYIPVGL